MSGDAGLSRYLEERERRFNSVEVSLVCGCGHRVVAIASAEPAGRAGGEARRLLLEHYAKSPGCAPDGAA